MLTVNAYAAPSATAPLARMTITRRPTGRKDVLIEIRYVGICHSDIHIIREGAWPVEHPLVVGHEIVGIVAEVGAEVTKYAVGDRVGVGCLVNSCRNCDNCLDGEEQYCSNGRVFTFGSSDTDGNVTQGGYSTHIVVNEDFVLRVPGSLDFAAAAPLLCAGITTYSPLRHWRAEPGRKVAVVGMGGLGHVAVKLATAMGAEVTVLSRTLSKKEDGLRFGARDFYATEDPHTFEQLRSTFDLILNTVFAPIDLDEYLSLLQRNGTMVNVGAIAKALPLKVSGLSNNRRSLAGSSMGGIRETQEMLDFCAEHGISPETEIIDASQINEAWERVLKSDVRYRFVIDALTMR